MVARIPTYAAKRNADHTLHPALRLRTCTHAHEPPWASVNLTGLPPPLHRPQLVTNIIMVYGMVFNGMVVGIVGRAMLQASHPPAPARPGAPPHCAPS